MRPRPFSLFANSDFFSCCQIDENYVGEPPKVEVTIENLNDNVDQTFLRSMVDKFGQFEDMVIQYHPLTRKHLGLARIHFETPKAAKECVAHLHGKSVMGKQLNCYIDPYGRSFQQMFIDLTTEKKPEPEPLPDLPEMEDSPPPPPVPPSSSDNRKGRSEDGRRSPARRHRSQEDDYGGTRNWQDRRDSRESRDRRRGDRDWKQSDSGNQDWQSNDHSQPPPPIPYNNQYNRSVSQREEHHHRDHNSHALHRQRSHPPAQPQKHNDEYAKQQPGQFEPPQYNQLGTDYWVQQAQQYAAQAAKALETTEVALSSAEDSSSAPAKQPPPPPIISQMPLDELPPGVLADIGQGSDDEMASGDNDDGGVGAEGSDSGGEHKVDLDTRLKMLMKDKTVPAFLLEELNNSDEEEEEGEAKSDGEPEAEPVDPNTVPGETPLDRPPSPFLSSTHYLECFKEWQEEFAESLKKGKRTGSRNSDRMSLSSLSSAENNILEQGPGDSASYLPPPEMYPGFYPPGTVPPPGGVPNSFPPGTYPPPPGATVDAYGQYYDPNLPPGSYPYPPGWNGETYGAVGENGIKSSMDTLREIIQ